MLALVLLLGTLHGVVMRGPITPVCMVGKPCDAPAAHFCLSFGDHRVTTDANGRYRIRLRAGTYAVRACTTPSPGRGVEPRTVRVRPGVDTRVDLNVDTGIR